MGNKYLQSKAIVKYTVILIGLYIIFLSIKDLKNSLFLKSSDRINLFFFGKEARYYSIGLDDNVNYVISFSPDIWFMVPGGYGKYRLGGLGKLVDLEKKPEIFRKTVSLNTSSFTHYYFYPVKTEIYYGEKKNLPAGRQGQKFNLPGIAEFFFERSNAHLFDRIYLYILLAGKSRYSFKEIKDLSYYQDKDSSLFSSEDFFRDYQGYFYRSSYRRENSTVQITYTKSYKTTQLISRILEGEGIRVVDVEQKDNDNSKCQIISAKNKLAQTARDLSIFLGCLLHEGKTDFSDIILQLGSIEKEWEID